MTRLLREQEGHNWRMDDPAGLYLAHTGRLPEPPEKVAAFVIGHCFSAPETRDVELSRLEYLAAGTFDPEAGRGWTGAYLKFAVYMYSPEHGRAAAVILRTDGGGSYLRAGPRGTATVRLANNHELVVEDGDLTPIRTRPDTQAAATPTPRAAEEEPDGVSYDSAFILNNPIPAGCAKCNYRWIGPDAIRAPSLENCSCFYCGGRLVPLDKEGYKRRLETLHLHVVGRLTTETSAPAGPPRRRARTNSCA